MKKAKATALISSFGASVKGLIHWFGERFKDLFYATGNEHLELSRAATGLLTAVAIFAIFWNTLYLGQAIPIGELLNGLAAFAAAAGIGIAAKDWVRSKTIAKEAETQAAIKLAENVNTAAVLLAENVEERKDAEQASRDS